MSVSFTGLSLQKSWKFFEQASLFAKSILSITSIALLKENEEWPASGAQPIYTTTVTYRPRCDWSKDYYSSSEIEGYRKNTGRCDPISTGSRHLNIKIKKKRGRNEHVLRACRHTRIIDRTNYCRDPTLHRTISSESGFNRLRKRKGINCSSGFNRLQLKEMNCLPPREESHDATHFRSCNLVCLNIFRFLWTWVKKQTSLFLIIIVPQKRHCDLFYKFEI